MDSLVRLLNELIGIKAVAYADDLAIVVSGSTEEQIERRFARAYAKVTDWCTYQGMAINPQKSEAITFPAGRMII